MKLYIIISYGRAIVTILGAFVDDGNVPVSFKTAYFSHVRVSLLLNPFLLSVEIHFLKKIKHMLSEVVVINSKFMLVVCR
jgi:hypothetical protein